MTHPEELKLLVNTDPERTYSGTFDYLVSQIPLDKLRLTDSVSEKESEKSIITCSHDMFVEINSVHLTFPFTLFYRFTYIFLYILCNVFPKVVRGEFILCVVQS